MHVHFCSLTLKPQTMATLKPHQPLHHQNIKDQRQKRIICKLRDALLTRIAASSEPSKPIINSEGLKSNIDRRLRELIPTVHTPTHPPYASMIQRAIEELDEEGGLSEVAISEFIKREYEDLPVAHEGFLRHHLRKLCESGVVVNLEGGRYNLVVEEGDDGGVVDRESTSERWPGREDRGEIERMEEKMKGEEWQSEVMRRLDVQKQEHFEVIENKCEAQGKQMEVNEGQLEMASMELDVEGSSNKEAILGDIESEVYENEVIQGNHHREEQQSGEVYKQNEPQAQEIEVIENHFQPQAGKVSEIGEGVQGQDIEVRTKILELCCHGDENLRTQGDVPLADRLQQSPLQGQEKRRPGRPRKPRKSIESTSRALLLLAPEIHHEEEPPRRRGMPRKAKKDMDASTRALMPCGGPQHHDEEQPPRRRRRRPKPKPDSETSLAVVSCSDKQQQQQPQYRGRGRPPKPKPNSETSLAVVSCSDKQQKQPQYRGRGRHPKPKLDAENVKNPPQTPQIEQLQQKRRGRGKLQ